MKNNPKFCNTNLRRQPMNQAYPFASINYEPKPTGKVPVGLKKKEHEKTCYTYFSIL